jgi:hypothetical protein
LGDVQATGTRSGVTLTAAEAGKLRRIVQHEDQGNVTHSTRVILEYQDGPVALVRVADLAAGGPVTGATIS